MKQKNRAAVALGRIKSERKAESSRANGLNWQRPHLAKVALFEKWYPYPLVCNEWKVKWPMIIAGKTTTYNPDYLCPTTDFYIEVATSVPNMGQQGPKWEEAIRLGYKLKVFWWEGEDITDRFTS